MKKIAQFKPGEKILIHAAAGGVGMAAVQLCLAMKINIFATASSPEKHRALSEMGVQHIFNSRNVNFANEIEHIIGKNQIDIVLNSLVGEFIPASMSLLKPHGRFIEIGKKEILANQQIENIQNDIQYYHFDLAQIAKDMPEVISTLLNDICDDISTKRIKPLAYTFFESHQTQEAFRYMAQAKHIGKIVVRPVAVKTNSLVIADSERSPFNLAQIHKIVDDISGLTEDAALSRLSGLRKINYGL